MYNNKYLLYALLVAVFVVGLSSMSLAHELKFKGVGEDDNDLKIKIEHGIKMAGKAGTQMILQVGPSGNVLLRGTVSSVDTTTSEDSLVVKTWGGDWIVNVSSDDTILPQGSSLSDFEAGDFVGVNGSINQSTAFTVDAKVIKDWTLRKDGQELKDSFKPKNFEGTASNINTGANTLTLTVDGVAYTVNIAVGAKIVNKNYATIALADIQSGHTVRVWATVSGTTLTAYLVRDTSIP